MKRTIAALAFVIIGLAASGCSSDNDSQPAPVITTTTAVTSAALSSTTEAIVTTPPEPALTSAVYYEETTTDETQPWVPVVTLGEECGPRGSTAVTVDGATAYCSRLAQTDGAVWWTSPGVAPNMRIATPYTPPPTTKRPYPTADESFIETCMGKTGQTRAQCIASIQHGIDAGNIVVP
ncbi:hypothetical protein [Rhodococcus sp. ARC_M6]|uniref:hypothetical protein n=1 Tax=Rhodococcus sp. ARC_M6 TaxID=2928852 RepID=UPI001FB50E6D|nr:hypothetical protein [Rhodococcus sp. ARC_M6]MCJ0907468.1 hypothetical protein [Rhodococcus sp. ARC_M6]